MKKYLTKIFREILMDLMNEAYQRGKSEGREIGYKEGQESVKRLDSYMGNGLPVDLRRKV
jgi:flagellar biosynthesis/type III secretory pathway protein FliH